MSRNTLSFYLCFAVAFILYGFQKSQDKTETPEAFLELVDIEAISDEFFYDIRYATSANILDQPIYDCAKCYLQPEVAQALYLANQYFCEKGYFIQLFDCYRPISAQKKMWAIYPNPTYVANPYTKGSIHSRAAAIDLTLVDERGCPLDMGSDYDFFGRASHTDNFNLPEQVLKNRKLLQDGLAEFGFSTIRTEWWHFTFRKNYRFKPLDIPFNCLKD